MYAAAADVNAGYPRSCGRCYQVGLLALAYFNHS
jgi:hypothetical protein